MGGSAPVHRSGPGMIKLVEETPNGRLTIYNRCRPGALDGLVMDEGLGKFSHYSSIIQRIEALDRVTSHKDGRVTLALWDETRVVGYAACWYPGPEERWRALGDLMYEMGAIETSRTKRGMGIAGKVFAALLDDDFFEDKICYLCGYSWTWDLDGSRMTIPQYRRALIALYRTQGFKECYTNEPNIALREENFFMVRIGSRVSEEDVKRFKNLRFGIKERN
ncbi:MAG: N-acetyltransferase [Thermodesulfobacteriota bacterium]